MMKFHQIPRRLTKVDPITRWELQNLLLAAATIIAFVAVGVITLAIAVSALPR